MTIQGQIQATGTRPLVMMVVVLLFEETRRQTFRAEDNGPAIIQAARHVAGRCQALQKQGQRNTDKRQRAAPGSPGPRG